MTEEERIQSHRDAVARHIKHKKLTAVLVRMPEAHKTEIEAAAATAGQSVQRYILDAVAQRMAQESTPEGTGEPQSGDNAGEAQGDGNSANAS